MNNYIFTVITPDDDVTLKYRRENINIATPFRAGFVFVFSPLGYCFAVNEMLLKMIYLIIYRYISILLKQTLLSFCVHSVPSNKTY